MHEPPFEDAHIPAERLAALADDPPTPAEALHLERCQACTGEVRVYQKLFELTRAERDHLAAPLTDWATLEPALAREGLLGARPRRVRPAASAGRLWQRHRRVLGAAAASALLATGVGIGRWSSPRPLPSTGTGNVASDGSIATTMRSISDTHGLATFASTGDAMSALQQADEQYRRAAAYLMNADTSANEESTDGYRARLTALDQVTATTRQALQAAPNDPVLNQWYISSVGARQATLRQIRQSLPQDQKLRY